MKHIKRALPIMKQNRKNKYLEFHDLLFEFQRVQRFTASHLGMSHDHLGEGLSYTEESVLFVLDAGEASNVKELSERVGLERSWMSRMVGGLEQRDLLTAHPDPSDGRSKILKLTREGEKQLLKAEDNAKRIFELAFAPLSQKKQKELEKILSKIADGLGAKQFKKHRAGHMIGYQLGRISAVIGIYGRALFGTQITNTQLHILLILNNFHHTPLQISDIDRCVSFDMSTVSRTVQSLVDERIIEKNKGTTDKRSVALMLSKHGIEVFKSYRQDAIKILASGLDPLSDSELEHLIEYYRELTASLPRPGSQAEISARSHLTLKPIMNDASRGSRSESTLLSRLKSSQPGSAVAKCIGAYKGSTLVAAVGAEYSKKDGSLSELMLVNNGADLKDCRALVEEFLKV